MNRVVLEQVVNLMSGKVSGLETSFNNSSQCNGQCPNIDVSIERYWITISEFYLFL